MIILDKAKEAVKYIVRETVYESDLKLFLLSFIGLVVRTNEGHALDLPNGILMIGFITSFLVAPLSRYVRRD